MIHHVSLGSNDIAKARAFYDPLMSLIGFRVLKASAIAAYYGASDIVFSLETPVDGNPASPGNGVHVAFQAPDRETVGKGDKTRSAASMTVRPIGPNACV
jgi:catechol 2,3-dioxygenase-like lactoylglutathione lyase family enzyme